MTKDIWCVGNGVLVLLMLCNIVKETESLQIMLSCQGSDVVTLPEYPLAVYG